MILDRLLGRSSLATKIGGRPLTDPAVISWLGGGRTSSAGTQITEDKAVELIGHILL